MLVTDAQLAAAKIDYERAREHYQDLLTRWERQQTVPLSERTVSATPRPSALADAMKRGLGAGLGAGLPRKSIAQTPAPLQDESDGMSELGEVLADDDSEEEENLWPGPIQPSSDDESDRSTKKLCRRIRGERARREALQAAGGKTRDDPLDIDNFEAPPPSPPHTTRRRRPRIADSDDEWDAAPQEPPRRTRQRRAQSTHTLAADSDDEPVVSDLPAVRPESNFTVKQMSYLSARRRAARRRSRRADSEMSEIVPGEPPRRPRRPRNAASKTKYILDPPNETTLMPWSAPTHLPTASPSASPRIKREHSPSPGPPIKRERLTPPPLSPHATPSSPPDIKPLPPPPAPAPPTAWNDAILNSSTPDRKPHAHELLHTKPPYLFPSHTPPLCPTPYTRAFLSSVLGGSAHSSCCTVSIAKRNTNNHRLAVFFCKDPAWDPFLPARAGAHGVAYWCKWSTALRLDCSTPRPVFCKRRPNCWEYCGEYVMATRAMAEGEWDALPAEMRARWVDGFVRRRGMRECLLAEGLCAEEEITRERVAAMIADGRIPLKSQVYECVGYNWELARWLDERWARWVGRGGGVKEEEGEEEEDMGVGGL